MSSDRTQTEAEAATHRTDVVYVIGSPDSPLVKIGRTGDIARRLAGLRRMSPVPLDVLCTMPGGAALEAALHRRFAPQRRHGEWFELGRNPADAVRSAAMDIVPAPRTVTRGGREVSATREGREVSGYFLVLRIAPQPEAEGAVPRDALERVVPEWLDSRNEPFHCKNCTCPIGIHSPVRPHMCDQPFPYDDWCMCTGYEGDLPSLLEGYDLPGQGWRFWRR
ncbi:GIY-YIG nuclease family protein [Streptomyces sp. NBC_00154]|uniref:GIY-YIG nuclease family protein n=1 Tax=Streptomyces sp. NBC_00154 TaxID=2975670 RepID=UPI00338F681D